MFVNVISLEFDKQKRGLVGILLVGAVALFAALAQALVRRSSLIESIEAVILVAFLSLPLLALLFGAMAAAGLRSELRRAAEDPLPFSPRQRVLGAYALSLALFLALAIAVVFFASATHAIGFLDSLGILDSTALLGIGIVYTHFLAFAFTYWTGQPLLGAGLATIASGLTIVCLRGFESLNSLPLFFMGGGESSVSLLISAAGSVWLAGLAALAFLATRVDRFRKLGVMGIPVLLALASAPVLGFAAVQWRTHILKTELHLLPFWGWMSHRMASDRNAYRFPLEGSLFYTASGSIVRIQGDGARDVLYESPGVSSFGRPAVSGMLVDYLVENGRELSVLLRPDIGRNWDLYEIVRGSFDGSLETFTTFQSENITPQYLTFAEGNVWICGRSETEEFHPVSCALMPQRGKLPQWNSVSPREGAAISENRSTLAWKNEAGQELRWNLSGVYRASSLRSDSFSAAYWENGRPVFVVPVAEPNGEERLVFCRTDGTMQDPWGRTWGKDPLRMRPAMGGTVWITGPWRQSHELLALSEQGRTFPAIPLTDLYREAGIPFPDGKNRFASVQALRIHNSSLWVILDGTFVKVDLIQRKLDRKLAVLAENTIWNQVSLLPSRDGVYFLNEGRVNRVDWEGAIIDLGEAEM